MKISEFLNILINFSHKNLMKPKKYLNWCDEYLLTISKLFKNVNKSIVSSNYIII